MKVLYLAPSSKTPGAILRYAHMEQELHALAESGLDMYVISTREGTSFDEGRIHVRALPPGKSVGERLATVAFLARHVSELPPAALMKPKRWYEVVHTERFAARLIAQEGIDVIHSQFGWPGGSGGLLARAATAAPLVAAFIGAEVNTIPAIGYGMRNDAFYDRLIRRLMKRADRALYVSDFLYERARRLGAPASNSRVVRNAVDGERFAAVDRPALRRELDLDGRPVILTVAGLVPVKGVNHLLEAAALLRSSHDFTLVIAGEGTHARRLRQLADRLSIGDRTRFVGRIPPEVIPKYFGACDIFALGSLVESAGIVLLEAMAAGRPVVCTNAGGPPEYVQDEVTGYIVPPADPQAMAAKLRLLLERPDLRESLGREGRARVNRCFPYTKRLRELRESYLEAMRLPRAGRIDGTADARIGGMT